MSFNKSHWNYRIVRTRGAGYTIHEVYYNGEGEPDALTKNDVGPRGDTLSSFLWACVDYLKAFVRPILLYAGDRFEGEQPSVIQVVTRWMEKGI